MWKCFYVHIGNTNPNGINESSKKRMVILNFPCWVLLPIRRAETEASEKL